jgi:eukaryotic-like serine/threonine-protein kinase
MLPHTTLWGDADARAARKKLTPVKSTEKISTDSIGHIGRYALKYQLGEGGLGTVYAAHDPLLSRLIAVKTLHLEIEESEREAFNALFLNEARAAAGLSHPHIVTVFDAGISDDRAYIAMELLKGSDLRQLRKEGWRATPAQAALIVRRVADALGYAHDRGVIHRDVKPANIFMVTRTQPRVLDFGIARIAHQQDATYSDNDLAAGSPYYMAPEQVRHETVDKRGDVFSLGVVLYELLTNVKPFRGSTLEEINTAVLEHQPPLAHVVDPAVPEALARIAAKALSKSPEKRFRSARAFGRELRSWLDENSVGADTEGSSMSGSKIKPWWFAAAGIGALAVGATVWTLFTSISAVVPTANTKTTGNAASKPQLQTEVATAAPASAAASGTASSALTTEPRVTTKSGEIANSAASEAARLALLLPTRAGSNATNSASAAVVPIPVPAWVDAPTANTAPATTKPLPPQPKQPHAVNDAANLAAKIKAAREREVPTPPGLAVAPKATAPSSSVKAVAAATGTVKIAISPWGEVQVDGKPVGTSPPLTELKLTAGRHQIVFRNTDLPPHTIIVNLTANQSITLKHRF